MKERRENGMRMREGGGEEEEDEGSTKCPSLCR